MRTKINSVNRYICTFSNPYLTYNSAKSKALVKLSLNPSIPHPIDLQLESQARTLNPHLQCEI